MRVFVIDIDGTALKYPEQVRKLYENPRHFILLYTARSESMRKQTIQQLNKRNVPYHALRMDKPRGDCYIDDKNMGGLKWPK